MTKLTEAHSKHNPFTSYNRTIADLMPLRCLSHADVRPRLFVGLMTGRSLVQYVQEPFSRQREFSMKVVPCFLSLFLA